MKASAWVLVLMLTGSVGAVEPAQLDSASKVEFRWGEKIEMRDGIHLSATVYTPKGDRKSVV